MTKKFIELAQGSQRHHMHYIHTYFKLSFDLAKSSAQFFNVILDPLNNYLSAKYHWQDVL